MLTVIRLNISHFFCLLLACYILNFSIDAPAIDSPYSTTQHKSDFSEVKNLMEMLLDIELEISRPANTSKDSENEAENELTDSPDLFHTNTHKDPNHRHAYFYSKSFPYQLGIFEDNYPELSPPPPRQP